MTNPMLDFIKSLFGPPTTEYVVSQKPYEVLEGHTAQERAEFLYKLEQWANDFLDKALARWPKDQRLLRIKSRWNGRLNEVTTSDDAAFSRGKRSIYVCVWDKATNRLESPYNAKYILLHEFAHVANKTYGHDAPFWKAFSTLLEMAELVGSYQNKQHAPESTYCGHRIGRSPAACVFEGSCDSFVEAPVAES